MANIDTKKFIQNWREKRKIGKILYISITIIKLGITWWIASLLGMLILHGNIDFSDVTYLFAGLVLGAIFGNNEWNKNEKRYNDFLKNKKYN